MEAAAAKLSGSIVDSKQDKIAVFDFSGPGDRMTALGAQLADELNAELAKSPKLKMEDRSRIEKAADPAFYSPQMLGDLASMLAWARDLGAKAFVSGEISIQQDNRLNVEIKVFRTKDGKGIDGLMASFPLDQQMAKLVAIDLPQGSHENISDYPDAKTALSAPVCVYCPSADYSSEAAIERVQGIVTLVAVIGTDGRIQAVRVVKGLPAGLTAEAIKAVRHWQLEPAKGPDGKPVAVRQVIEVGFRVNR